MPDSNLNDFFGRFASGFDPQKAAGVDADIQLTLTGEHPGNWYVGIHDQQATPHEGLAPNPKLTISAASQDFMDLFQGKMDPMQAFIQGKIKIAGDMMLAMKLMNIFKVK